MNGLIELNNIITVRLNMIKVKQSPIPEYISSQAAIDVTITDSHNAVRIISDGTNAGTKLRFWKPDTNPGYWVYDISPQDKYVG